jgi:hypothetical protein
MAGLERSIAEHRRQLAQAGSAFRAALRKPSHWQCTIWPRAVACLPPADQARFENQLP